MTGPYAEAAQIIDRMTGLQLVMWLSIGRDLAENPERDTVPRKSGNVIPGPGHFRPLLDLAESGAGML